MKILPSAAASLAVAAVLSSSTGAQSLGDAARRAEEERAKAKQGSGKVFTNKDLGDAPAPPPASAADAAPSSSGDASTPARNRLDPTAAADPAPVSSADGRIEVRRVGSVRGNAYETALSMPLRGPKGAVPSTLILRATHEDRLPIVNTPVELHAEFAMHPTFGGQINMKPPHVVFIADEAQVFTGSVDSNQAIGSFLTVIIPISLNALARLERASKISGRLFDLEFVFTPGQLRLVADFSQRARKNPAAGF